VSGRSKKPRTAEKKTGKSLAKTAAQQRSKDKTRRHHKNSVEETSTQYGTQSSEGGQVRFIDLFCGIGGFRIAFEKVGGQCVFSSDYDTFSQQTYEANFGEKPHGDIHSVAVADIPAHDILCAGFPCQPFSIAGVSKKLSLGLKHGFDDVKQGNLFFSIADILDFHRPAAFVLENVKNLKGHDGGKTFEIIYHTLTEALGYTVYHKIIDAKGVVPQHRERIFIVGFRNWRYFEFPKFPSDGPRLGDILEPDPHQKYTLSEHLWKYLQNYAAKHRAAGNGFGFGLVTDRDIARTLSARYYKDGSEILVAKKAGGIPRRLTPRECARLMGYPDSFKIVVSDTQAYRQFGNSVVVPVVKRIASAVLRTLQSPLNTPADFVLTAEERPKSAPIKVAQKAAPYPKPKRSQRKKSS
jgi:DNA (cytosine-5)-methyltransferase 1